MVLKIKKNIGNKVRIRTNRQSVFQKQLSKNPYDRYIKLECVILVDAETKKRIQEYNLEDAIQIAKEKELNLIQISVACEKAICILGNYSKYMYKISKQENLKKKQQAKLQNKEVTISSIIDLTDMVRKLEKIVEYVVTYSYSVTLVIKKRRKRDNITYFSDDFITNFFKSNSQLQYRVTKKTEKQSNFYIVKKK